jgi:guanylate kinase
VGKGTVVRRVLALVPGLDLSVSVTTRPPRPAERDGVDYHFVDDGAFDAMVERGDLLEWAEIFGHRSGTPAGPIERLLEDGRDVVLEIDVQGAEWVRRRRPDAVLIFLEPPSLEELERRLRARGTEDEEKLARRLAKAGHEMGQQGWFDHVVVNDDVERASQQVAAIIDGSRTAPERPSASSVDGSDLAPTARPEPRPEPRKDPA